MGEHSVALKNDPLCGFLANKGSIRDSSDGLTLQNQHKLHKSKIAVDTQNASIQTTKDDMGLCTKKELEPTMEEASEAKQDEVRISAPEMEVTQEINEAYEMKEKKIVAIEIAFAKYRDDKLAGANAEKAISEKERMMQTDN